MKNIRTLAILNFISFLIHVTLSWLTQFKLINEQDVGEISGKYPSLFTPAPFTFGIWGIIYLSLAAFCIYHLVMAFRKGPQYPANSEINDIGGWFILNNLVTAGWLFAFTRNYILLSVVLIAIQLISLIAIHLILHIYNTQRTAGSKVFTQFPLSIYFGWITIATIANISAYLVSIGWNGFGWNLTAAQWTILLIVVAILISLLVILTRRNVFYGLVIIWAFYGIIVARKSESASLNADIINACWLGIGVVAAACLFRLVRNLLHKTTPARYPVADHSLK